MTETFADTNLRKFESLTKKPEKFLSKPGNLLENIKVLIKDVYDFTKQQETFKTSETLNELVVNDFDVEQIWQQIELQNNAILTKSLISVSRLVAAKDRLWFVNVNNEEEEDVEEDNAEDEEDNVEDEEDNVEDEEDNVEDEEEDKEDTELNEAGLEEHTSRRKSFKPSIVDDQFFKLNEMEEFLLKEEKATNKNNNSDDDEESVDLFDGNDDDFDDGSADEIEGESKTNPKYSDFFKEENQMENNKRKREHQEFEEEEEEINLKSNLELREERLRKKIKEIEEIALEEKPWQLKGEISASKRPQNSLLEEIVEFDLTTRPAPVITEETTLRLEDVIRQRIKDKVWDDVVRKQKIAEGPAEYKKKLMLDQEKSKQSLAQIYENEFLKQKAALDPDAAEKPDEEPKEHIEIKTMMKSLFLKLDALSNFHFTPKTVTPELRIVNNMPAINMEEVAPVAASDAALLAPEEVHKKPKGDIVGKGERTTTDKKRQRRQKKTKQKEHAVQQQKKEIEKLRPGLGNKYSKEKTAKLLERVTKERNVDKMDESSGAKSVKSSSAFFTQLQEEVKGAIKSKTAIQKKKNKQTFTGTKLKM